MGGVYTVDLDDSGPVLLHGVAFYQHKIAGVELRLFRVGGELLAYAMNRDETDSAQPTASNSSQELAAPMLALFADLGLEFATADLKASGTRGRCSMSVWAMNSF